MADEEKPPELDEAWLMEWFESGYTNMLAYLRPWFAFGRYCDDHKENDGNE